MENNKLDLLNDITKLLKKYGADVFYDLLKFLKDEKFSNTLAELLIKFSEEGKKHNITSSKKKSKPLLKIREQLVSLKETDIEKAEILLEFYDKIYSQGVTLKLKDIKNYASDIGFDIIKIKKKDDAISKLLRHLMNYSLNELHNLLNQFKSSHVDGDRSLEGWSNIILKKDNK